MQYFKYFFLLLFLNTTMLFAFDSYEGKQVGSITITMESTQKTRHVDTRNLLSKLKTKQDAIFSDFVFDEDLKALAADYDQVIPSFTIENDKLFIVIKLTPKPVIQNIRFEGNKKISSSTLKKELGIESFTPFNREKLHKALGKLKELYVKKGYFEVQINYQIVSYPENKIALVIQVTEGRSGIVQDMIFKGFSDKEKSDVLKMIYTKKHNLFTSWVSGTGIFRKEVLEQDQMAILNYFHNIGYADAKVDIKVSEDPATKKILITIVAVKGILYHFGSVQFTGNTLYTNEEIQKEMTIKNGDPYSPEQIRESIQRIKDLYGKKGHIEAHIQEETYLRQNEPLYDVTLRIEEGQEFLVGLIHIFGNCQTETNVILHDSLLVPGDVFDIRKLKATQARLQNIGFFKNVNVYAVKSPDDYGLGSNYRDVYIEVEEASTGSFNLFAGFSRANSVTGGLELTEKNFNHKGLFHPVGKGRCGLRGGGEYFHAKFNIGARQGSLQIGWMNPYFNDSLWRIGFDANVSNSNLQSKDYRIRGYGFSLFGSYPLSNYLTFGTRYRMRDSHLHIKDNSGTEAQDLEKNDGFVSGVSINMAYDSTDNPYKSHRGLRSFYEVEYDGVGGRYSFLKFAFLQNYYIPLWKNGTLKCRGEVRFIHNIKQSKEIPLSERFFLGGEGSIRGLKPFIVGPRLVDQNGNIKYNEPSGGLSSALMSLEVNQEIHRLVDFFIFADSGYVTMKEFSVPKLVATFGFGTRLELMNRIPLTLGLGIPIKEDYPSDTQKFFFSMSGQF